MHTIELEVIQLVGLSLRSRTSNENGKSSVDCGNLWQEFEQENYSGKIPGKLSDDIFAVYHQYEGSPAHSFSYFIGCQVEAGAHLPEGFDNIVIPKGWYQKITSMGKMPDSMITTWKEIENCSIPRAYQTDFEVYGERSKDWSKAEIQVYISMNPF